MPDFIRRRIVYVLVLCLLGITSSALLAQDMATETPIEITPSATTTDIPDATATEIPTDTPTTVPTETTTEIPTEVVTEILTETPFAETSEPVTETVTTSPTIDATPTTPAVLLPEPALSLLIRELFEVEPLIGWTLPTGWIRTADSDGFALQVSALEAGLDSLSTVSGDYYNLAVMGSFTFENSGTAQLIVRNSSAGSYVAQVDANGLVILEKRDAAGIVVASWNAIVPAATASALRLSAIGGVLRVAVNNIEVLAANDTTPLPPGSVKVGANFGSPEGQPVSGTILFDDFFLWVPGSELSLYTPTTMPPSPLPIESVIATPIPAPNNLNGKSTIPQPPGLIAGAQATSNNDFAARASVILPYGDNGNTTDNSVELPDEPTPSCGLNISHTAWYEFTPLSAGAISESYLMTSLSSSFDTIIAIYTGTGTLGSLTEVACADDIGGATQAKLTATLNDGITYYIQLGGYNGSYGNFSLAIIRPVDALVPGAPAISATAVGAPSTPVGSAGKTSLPQPVVAWNAGGSVVPFSYEIQVSTTNNFVIPVATGIIYEPSRFYQIAPALPQPALPTGQVYYWRVRARNFLLQTSAWSAIYSFTLDGVAPPPPTLTAPTASSVVASLRPTFTWQPVADVNLYQIRVATNFSCTTVVSGVFDTQVTTTTFKPTSDLPQGEYWFCVQAKDIAGNWSGFGEKRRFAVNISLTPAPNATIVVNTPATSADVKFTWTAISGASYGIQIATDSSFTDFITDENVTGTSYTRTGIPFGNYYWRVSVNGNSLPSALSYHFTITPPIPVAPLIQTTGAQAGAVKNPGFTNDTTPILDWTIPSNWVVPPPGNSISYELQLSTDKNFTALVGGTITGIFPSDYEWTATTLPNSPGTAYYWRLRAVTNLGLNGNWSVPFSFTLDTDAPNAPESLTAPADNFVSTPARPSFTWATPLGGASSYRFELSTDNTDFDPPAIPDTNVTTPRYTPPVSLPQGIYYWQVWAQDAAGNESLSSAGFRTLTVDYRIAPTTNHTVITTTNGSVTFSWMLATGAPTGTTYTIELDYDLDGNPDGNLQPVTTTTATAIGLAQGDYQYRLLVDHGLGTSGWRPFLVSPPLPGAPLAPFTPANNTLMADSTPLLSWAAPTVNPGTVTGYKVEISTTSSFSIPIAGSPFDADLSISFTPPALTDNKYFWRVRAYNSLGAGGTYSATQSFTLDTTAPNPPASLKNPADNFVSTAARPAFSWTAPVGGATSYVFELSTDNTDFDPPAIPDAIVTTPSYTSTVSLPQGTYYWQVWARDAALNQSSIPAGFRTLTVDYRTAPAASYTAITATTINVTFSWMLVTGAPAGTTYIVEIDDDFDGNADITLPAVTSASTVASGLTQGDYQYRLMVNNGFGTSGWRTFYVSSPLPGVPGAPYTPLNNALTSDATPQLTWTAPILNPGNVAGYHVEISTSSNFNTPIAGSPFNAGVLTSLTLPAFTDATYYWRVRAYNSLGIHGTASSAWYFTIDTVGPNNAPNLTAPLDNSTTNLPRPTFTWSPATGANRYLIEIDNESSFNNPLFYTATSPTTNYTLPASTYLRQGTYYWRVWSMDAAGNLNLVPITPRTLNVNYAKTPLANAVITSAGSANVTFTWTAVPITPITASAIRLQIDDNSNFSTPELASSPLLASNVVTYTTTSAISPGKYYWRLLVNGHAVWSTTLARSFTISPAAPPAPALSALPAFTNDTTPVFTWNAVSSPAGATVSGYELQLSTTNNFAALVGGAPVTITGGGTTSYEWASTLPTTAGQMYYARIRAVNSLSIYGNWSAIRSFTLDTVAPGVPVLTAPAHNKTVTTSTPTFTWAAVIGAVRYEIRYATLPNLVGVTPIPVTTASYKPTSGLLFTNYYWEVRAFDAAGNTIDWDNASIWDSISNRRTVKIIAVP